MKKILLIILTSLMLFLFGCGEDKFTSDENIQKWQKEGNFKPSYGDRLMMRISGDPPTLNPVTAHDTTSSEVYQKIYESLMDIGIDLKVIPNLVEAYEISSDGLIFTFHLKEGLKWHDGKPLTTADVKFTYDVIMDPKSGAVNKRAGYETVKKLEIIDETTFKVYYEEPYAPALIRWTMTVIPKHIFEEEFNSGKFANSIYNTKPVGNGPFELEAWESNKRVVLKAHEKYHKGRPYFDKLIYRIIPEQTVFFQYIQSGRVDYGVITAEQYEQAKRTPKVGDRVFGLYDIHQYYRPAYTYVGWNMTGQNPFFEDKKVRQAMTYAVDREAIVKNILFGYGEVISGPFYIESWAYNHEVRPYPYNPEKAQQLLDEAGWVKSSDGIREKNGKKFEFEMLVTSSSTTSIKIATVMQDMLSGIGVKMNIRTLEWSTFLDHTDDPQKYTAYIAGWSLSLDPDPYVIWHSSQQETGLNKVGYKNTEVDRLIALGRKEMNLEKRAGYYREIHKHIAEDQPYMFVYISANITALHNRIKNTVYGPYGWFNIYNQGYPELSEEEVDNFKIDNQLWQFDSFKGAFVPENQRLY